jgi:coenzyme PQQ precursor peptide PqqA
MQHERGRPSTLPVLLDVEAMAGTDRELHDIERSRAAGRHGSIVEAGSRASNPENHEVRFMVLATTRRAAHGKVGPVPPQGGRRIDVPLSQGDLPMTWTTPAATDMRFGFEITMYISAR